MLRRLIKIASILCLVCAIAAGWNQAAKACEPDPACEGADEWFAAFDAFELRLEGRKSGDHITWNGRYTRTEPQDMEIAAASTIDGHPGSERLMLVSGQLLAVQSSSPQSASDSRAIDTPLIYLKLTSALLGIVFPEGPKSVAGERSFDIETGHRIVQVATPNADAQFHGPWRLSGTVTRPAPSRIAFELHYRSHDLRKRRTRDGDVIMPFDITISGVLEQSSQAFEIDGRVSLEGWSLLDLTSGPITPGQYASVADVRADLAKRNFVGEPDASTDLSGAWKSDCAQTFGMRVDKDPDGGMYTVAFCGPGGCMQGRNARRTYINKDPRYEVVEPGKLRINGDLHLRCGPPDDLPLNGR